MNKYILRKVCFWLILFLSTKFIIAQTTIGYTNGQLNKNEILRFGTSEKQGMAFYVDAEKAAILKGASVESFLTYVSTTQITSGTLFITRELGGTPLCELSFKPSSSREKMYEYTLDTPFVLDGEPFYVGHIVEVGTSYKPLSFDLSQNFEAGISWAYKDGQWVDLSQQGFGAPNIQIKVSGVDSFLDLMVKPVIPVGYQVAGKAQVFSGQVFNFGTETITSFDLTCKVGNAAPVTSHVSGVSLPSGGSYDFTLPECMTEESGTLDLEVKVSNVNGFVDAEVTDNTAKSAVYFYPVGVEKKILVEVFTGQACGNCPAGHNNLTSAMRGIEDEFIEVAHHAGYFPDQFSMKESYSLTWLYGTSGTFAPAAAFNRSLINEISTTSVVFATTDDSATRAAVQAFRNTQPYVGIKMFNEIDEATRTGKVTIDVHTYVNPGSQMHTLNVWLVQDSLVAMQASGGSLYKHNHVFRGSLNKSAWGQLITLNAGETRRYTFDYTIPEAIAATYGDYIGTTFDAVLSNMQIVAFVSDLSEINPTACNVYNAASIDIETGKIEKILKTLTYMINDEIIQQYSVEVGDSIPVYLPPTKIGHSFNGWINPIEIMPNEDVIVYGNYYPNSYHLSYEIEDSVIFSKEYLYGSLIETPKVPEKEGYTFSGWNEVPATMPASDIVIKGSYLRNSYVLTYMVDGVVYSSQTIPYESKIKLLNAPQMEGYTFSGWDCLVDSMPAYDLIVNGYFTINSYTLTYIVDGKEYKQETKLYGTQVELIDMPEKKGYTFSGWGDVPNTMPSKDLALKGEYVVNKHSIIYYVDGTIYKTFEVNYGSLINLIDEPRMEGYTFSGWSENPETMPDNDVTIEGTFNVNKYAIKYIVDGEEYAIDSIIYNEQIVLRPFPNREGYTFRGWTETPTFMPAYDIVVSGEFSINSYQLTYVIDGNVYTTMQVVYGTPIYAIANPSKEGYIFSGWSEIPKTMPAEDVIVIGFFEVDGINAILSNRLVDVYTLQGVMVKRDVPMEDLEKELSTGIYIVNGKKFIVK